MLSNSVLNLYPFFSTQPPKKKQKLSHYSAEIVVEIQDRNGENVPIRALLDTGTSSTLLLRDFVAKGRAKGFEHQPTKWATLGGNFVTNRKALVEFKFPELSISKTVTWIVHVNKKTSREMAAYDMIIGMDLMTAIGIFVNTRDKTVEWEGHAISLKERGELQNHEALNYIYHTVNAPSVIMEAEERQSRILDANYEAVNVKEYVNEIKHLSDEEKSALTKVLQRHPKLFGGGLGILNIKPIRLEIQRCWFAVVMGRRRIRVLQGAMERRPAPPKIGLNSNWPSSVAIARKLGVKQRTKESQF
jgi:predicted aspartyl protease